MPSLTKVGLSVVGACLCAALGAVGAVAYMTPVSPSSLTTPTHAPDFPVGTAEFDDARPVELTLSRGDDLTVVAPASGRVTKSFCGAGTPMESGKPVLVVDGAPLLGLATSVPLWRDLELGDEGEDVVALKAELARLGHPVNAEGPLTRSVLRALRDLFEQAGDTSGPVDQVAMSRIVWLPAPSTTINECLKTIGSAVTEGDAVASVPGALESAAVVKVPDGLLPGARVLDVDGTSVAVDPAVPVSDAAVLGQLSQLPSLQPATTDDTAGRPPAPTAQLRLATPETVSVVPPASVFGVVDGKGCVLSDGVVVPVAVVGSQLGQTYVVFEGSPTPTTVDVDPASETPCT